MGGPQGARGGSGGTPKHPKGVGRLDRWSREGQGAHALLRPCPPTGCPCLPPGAPPPTRQRAGLRPHPGAGQAVGHAGREGHGGRTGTKTAQDDHTRGQTPLWWSRPTGSNRLVLEGRAQMGRGHGSGCGIGHWGPAGSRLGRFGPSGQPPTLLSAQGGVRVRVTEL